MRLTIWQYKMEVERFAGSTLCVARRDLSLSQHFEKGNRFPPADAMPPTRVGDCGGPR